MTKDYNAQWPILLRLPVSTFSLEMNGEKTNVPKRSLQWFRRDPEKARDTNTHLYMTAMTEVKKKMESGTAVPCTATYGITKQKELGFNDVELAYALSAPWAAGIGTVCL